jgi:hypothetical protein
LEVDLGNIKEIKIFDTPRIMVFPFEERLGRGF